jgi:hypothetical protein
MFWKNKTKVHEDQVKLQDIEPKLKQIVDDLNRMAVKMDFLESNFRIFSTKFNSKLGKLPSESEADLKKKSFYSGVLLPD